MNTHGNNRTLDYRSRKSHISGTNNVVYPPSLSSKRTSQHQIQFPPEIEAIKQQHKNLKRDRHQDMKKALLTQIDQWEKESIVYIQLAAKNARNDLNQQTKILNSRLTNSITQLDNELGSKLKHNNYTNSDIERCKRLLETCEHELQQMSAIKINKFNLSSVPLIEIENTNMIRKGTINSSIEAVIFPKVNYREPAEHAVRSRRELPTPQTAPILSQQYPYPSVYFGVIESSQSRMYQLFEHLKSLPSMDKYGSMSGDCDFETTQMERFLSKTFDFKNLHRKYIVPGVKSFRLDKPISSMHPNTVIRFPSKITTKSFAMTVPEIRQWQSSYRVYADGSVPGMSKAFLLKALQGQSKYGEEAFLMKFVARISQCPILMEFDARIIPRVPDETWPHNIKLVSVTGIDFAGRIHDLNDITTYVSNWRDVYEIDPRSGLPLVYNSRDFRRLVNGPRGQLDQERLFHDLIRMARLRLEACDLEGVQIVVETGIGLGVFAGRSIGIDEKVRALSALAIRTVLEEDGQSYQNIRGVVFALPVFDIDYRNGQRQDTYHAFAEEFERNRYKGLIPVLIADQDMHRLTVAIARQGFIVSELNPADSHGVFGEYWQNRGPAVEEKLALTTLGLLVQHHLINPHVLNSNHYHLI
jgi:hypothetical protein